MTSTKGKKFTRKPKTLALVKKAVKTALHNEIEDKYLEKSPALQLLSTNGANAGILLNGMVSGSLTGLRVGREILNKHIQVRGYIYRESVAACASQLLHVALIYDREPNYVGITYANVFKQYAGTSGPMAMPNVDDTGRFQILKQMRIFVPIQFTLIAGAVSQNESSLIQPQKYYFDWKVKLNKKTLYSAAGNAGTVADINKGAIWMVYSSMIQDITPADTHSIHYQTRLLYEDA